MADFGDIRAMERQHNLAAIQAKCLKHGNNSDVQRGKVDVDHLNIFVSQQSEQGQDIGRKRNKKARKQSQQPGSRRERLAQAETDDLDAASLRRLRLRGPLGDGNGGTNATSLQLLRQSEHRFIDAPRKIHRPIQQQEMAGSFAGRIRHQVLIFL